MADRYYIPELGRYVDKKGRRIKKNKKTYARNKGMTVARAMMCAVKIANGRTCSAAEQRAAMKTIGWAVKVGRLKQRAFKKR